jgi:hypothetical protein
MRIDSGFNFSIIPEYRANILRMSHTDNLVYLFYTWADSFNMNTLSRFIFKGAYYIILYCFPNI